MVPWPTVSEIDDPRLTSTGQLCRSEEKPKVWNSPSSFLSSFFFSFLTTFFWRDVLTTCSLILFLSLCLRVQPFRTAMDSWSHIKSDAASQKRGLIAHLPWILAGKSCFSLWEAAWMFLLNACVWDNPKKCKFGRLWVTDCLYVWALWWTVSLLKRKYLASDIPWKHCMCVGKQKVFYK